MRYTIPLHVRLDAQGGIAHVDFTEDTLAQIAAILLPYLVQARKYQRRDTCHAGHAWTPDNTYIRRDGYRTCKACKAARARRTR